ncbi:MAG: hypothetical protein AAB534_03100 [Patescibacteria group bacterium]
MVVLNLTKEQESKFIHLPIQQAVYVPSTSNISEQLSREKLIQRVDEVCSFLASLFGGYNVYDLTGGYVIRKKGEDKIIKEHFVRVVSFATDEAFKKNQNKLFERIAVWAKEWGQESIGYEFEEDLYYIPK